MKTVCVTLHGTYEPATPGAPARSGARTREHFAERGVEASYFYGINAPKLGIVTTHPYEVDGGPGCGYNMGPKPTGCWLSHRAVWAAILALSTDDHVLVVEDDAKFPEDWRQRMDAALSAAPSDWDMIYVGSCCTEGRPRRHVGGELYDVGCPLCTHGYFVRRKALEVLIATQDEARCYAPIDISLTFHSAPRLKIYTVLPRILEQFDTFIPV